MRFKVDENLPVEAADLLRRAGHDAHTVHDQRMVGGDDHSLAEVCRRESRVIVTLDLHFADIRAYPPQESPGIIVLRPRLQAKPHVLDLMQQVLPLVDLELLPGRLWIATESGVRVRQGGSTGGAL